MREFKKKLALILAPRILYFYLWIVYLTSKHRYYLDEKSLEGNFIATFWHGEIPMQGFFYHHIFKAKHPHTKLDIATLPYGTIISEHSDGEIAAKLFSFFGFKGIRGSSTRGGAKALLNALNKLKSQWDIGLTPDGPKGPYHSIAKGAIALALKGECKIVGLRIEPHKFWQLKSWDKMKLPKPFGKISYYLLPPLFLQDTHTLEQNQEILKSYLEKDPKEYFRNKTCLSPTQNFKKGRMC